MFVLMTVTMRVLVREAKILRVRVRVSKRRRERERERKTRQGDKERGYLCVPKSRSVFQRHLCNEQGGWVPSLGR